jgi:uncharacterized protein (DUF58 family)
MSVLSAQVVAAVDDLELAARLVVEGMRAGGHRSPYHGFSAEFSQHRPYRPGDDIKHLDWKLLARTDRLYTRQFHESTNLSVMLLVDTSASMAFPEEGTTKFRTALVLAAALAHLVSRQGDSVGLTTSEEGMLVHLPARGGRPHLRTLIAHLDRLQPAGRWDPAAMIERGAGLLRRRGVLVVLSDLYDDEEETRTALRRAARRGHDVAILQVFSEEERTLSWTGEFLVEDAESGERRLVDADSARTAYLEGVGAFLARCREGARRDGIDYGLALTDEPPSEALRAFLLGRSAR